MKLSITKSDWHIIAWFYLIAIIVSLFGFDYNKGLYFPLTETANYIVFTALVAYSVVYRIFPRFFPKKQIWALIFWTTILMAICGMLELFVYRAIDGRYPKTIMDCLTSFKYWINGITSSAQNAGILIGILLGKKFYDAQLELQQRETEKKASELRLLKSQIDPHFLFNNLNAVDALIDQKPEVAKAYLNRLAQLYRYLISTKDDEVVLVEDELEFAKNYIFLLEQRFGKAYVFEISGNEKVESMIPPGALQTILENVVKHNTGTIVNPIKTSISIEQNQIIVSNNMKEKIRKDKTTGTGLNNLKVRYSLLSDSEMQIQKGEDFKVILPLIKEVS